MDLVGWAALQVLMSPLLSNLNTTIHSTKPGPEPVLVFLQDWAGDLTIAEGSFTHTQTDRELKPMGFCHFIQYRVITCIHTSLVLMRHV